MPKRDNEVIGEAQQKKVPPRPDGQGGIDARNGVSRGQFM